MINNHEAETLKEEYTIKKSKSGLEEAKRLDKNVNWHQQSLLIFLNY